MLARYNTPWRLGLAVKRWQRGIVVSMTANQKLCFPTHTYNGLGNPVRSLHLEAGKQAKFSFSGALRKQRSPNARLIAKDKALDQFCLDEGDLINLQVLKARQPYMGVPGPMYLYELEDIKRVSMTKWGSQARLDAERKRRDANRTPDEIPEHRREPMGGGITDLFRLLFGGAVQMREKRSALIDDNPVGPGPRRRLETDEKLRGSLRVVAVALASNAAITVGKFITFFATGSASMLSEAVHSLADTANQGLLAFGIMRSMRGPSKEYPYGFSKERYVWALISGMGFFFLGSGVSVYHGITGLINPVPAEDLSLAFPMLALGGLLEGGSFMIAFKQVRENATRAKMTVSQYIRLGTDPNDVAVFAEDGAAISGLGIATVGIGTAYVTGNPVWDSLGSIAIGTMLGAVAVFLVRRNANALIERSIDEARIAMIVDAIRADPVVISVHDVKATQIGTNAVRFKAEINFDGQQIARKYAHSMNHGLMLQDFKQVMSAADAEDLLSYHGERVIDQMGQEVDRLEKIIQHVDPEVRHVDLEIL
eukprot:Clim_evm5s169 gene=Clim_evmTU5s169